MKAFTRTQSGILGVGLVVILAMQQCLSAQQTTATTPPGEPYVWKNVKVVAGGFLPGIVFSTEQPGLAYCRTDIGSAYKWDDAAKQWIPLTDWCAESNLMGTESIAPDPVDANKVYIAAGMYSRDQAAIMRSTDQGKTFQVFKVPFAMGGNENGRGIGERLAIDPNNPDTLYFGSRHDGLWISTDAAETWRKVESFPVKGTGNPTTRMAAAFAAAATRPASRPATRGAGFFWPPAKNAGLSFIIFDASTGTPGQPTPVIYVGSTDPGEAHLFRSTDAGKTWQPVPGEPGDDLTPTQAQLDSTGILYLAYNNGVGPNGVTVGSVWKLNTKDGTWTDITPDKSADRPPGGYGGLSIDRQQPGTLAVATMNRWRPGDDVYRSTDGGQTWKAAREKSQRDASLSPYLFWGDPQPAFGWWIAALAIDPFDSNRACYATGATIWGTSDFANVSADQPTHWSVSADGIEETAILDLISPTAGTAHLISGFGDIGGFTHDDLTVSPPAGMHANPILTSTYSLDYAEKSPNIIVRSGAPRGEGPSMAWSEDGGHTWTPLTVPQTDQGTQRGPRGRTRGSVSLSADASTFLLLGVGVPQISKDRGQTWTACQGLPDGIRLIVADRANPNRLYALDTQAGTLYTSSDAGATFAAIQSQGLPEMPRPAAGPGGFGGFGGSRADIRLRPTLGKEGDLWLTVNGAMYHTADGGAAFAALANGPTATRMGFGMAAPGKDYPAIYVAGTLNGLAAIYRSDDAGVTWVRINDDQHQYGNRFTVITGDPRIYGRVYVGNDGRGILYADPAPNAGK